MIVNQLPAILAQRNISIRELSRMTGITYTTIRAVYQSERRSVQLNVLDAICLALAIQPGDIYKFTGEDIKGRGSLDSVALPDLPKQKVAKTKTKEERLYPEEKHPQNPSEDGWNIWD